MQSYAILGYFQNKTSVRTFRTINCGRLIYTFDCFSRGYPPMRHEHVNEANVPRSWEFKEAFPYIKLTESVCRGNIFQSFWLYFRQDDKYRKTFS